MPTEEDGRAALVAEAEDRLRLRFSTTISPRIRRNRRRRAASRETAAA